MIDKELAKQLRGQGLTYQKIANVYGVSRQYIFQLTHSIYAGERHGRGKVTDIPRDSNYQREYQRKYMLYVDGKLCRVNKRPRPDNICELCGGMYKHLHYHHWDNSNPSLGVWVCVPCHHFVERIDMDRDLYNKYLQLKDSITKHYVK